MIFHIAKRELYDNMNSLRFALTVLLILTLMIVNAVKHLGRLSCGDEYLPKKRRSIP